MTTPTLKFYSSAPQEKTNDDLEKRLGKKLNDANGLKKSTNHIKEMITFFKDKNHEPKKNYKTYKNLTLVLESVDRVVVFRATTISATGVGLIVVPISAEAACAPSLCSKIFHKIIKNKNGKYKEKFQKCQQTTQTFDKLYRKSLGNKNR